MSKVSWIQYGSHKKLNFKFFDISVPFSTKKGVKHRYGRASDGTRSFAKLARKPLRAIELTLQLSLRAGGSLQNALRWNLSSTAAAMELAMRWIPPAKDVYALPSERRKAQRRNSISTASHGNKYNLTKQNATTNLSRRRLLHTRAARAHSVTFNRRGG